MGVGTNGLNGSRSDVSLPRWLSAVGGSSGGFHVTGDGMHSRHGVLPLTTAEWPIVLRAVQGGGLPAIGIDNDRRLGF
jgi:hypothetical protein